MGVKDLSIAVEVLSSYISELRLYNRFAYVVPFSIPDLIIVILWPLSSTNGMHYVFLVVCLTRKHSRSEIKFPLVIILWQICLITLMAFAWYILQTRVRDC